MAYHIYHYHKHYQYCYHLYHHLIEMLCQCMSIVDVNIAWVHDSYDVSAGRCDNKVTDAVVKATNIKQLCICADVNASNNAVLT